MEFFLLLWEYMTVFINKKYKLTENTIKHNGRILYQIQALKDFGDVNKGELGGYVQSEDNLSQEDDAWVFSDAKVFDDAWVGGNAKVFGCAQISGKAHISDKAQVFSNAQVSDNADVYGNAEVYGDAQVYNDSEVSHGEFSEYLWYQIYEHENNQIVYTENSSDTLIQIQYKGKIYKLNKRLKSKEKIIEKALQLYNNDCKIYYDNKANVLFLVENYKINDKNVFYIGDF